MFPEITRLGVFDGQNLRLNGVTFFVFHTGDAYTLFVVTVFFYFFPKRFSLDLFPGSKSTYIEVPDQLNYLEVHQEQQNRQLWYLFHQYNTTGAFRYFSLTFRLIITVLLRRYNNPLRDFISNILNITFTCSISQYLFLNTLPFLFLQTFLLINSICFSVLSLESSVICQSSILFRSFQLCIVLFRIPWMLVTVSHLNHMTLHASNASRITT